MIPKNSSVAARELKARLSTIPPPLPKPRPRALTNPSEQTNLTSSNTESGGDVAVTDIPQQQQSGLFTLPIELRRAIYKLVFDAPDHNEPRGIFQILNTRKRLCYVNCPWTGHNHHFSRCFQGTYGDYATSNLYTTDHYDWCEMYGVKHDPIAILRTCRRV